MLLLAQKGVHLFQFGSGGNRADHRVTLHWLGQLRGIYSKILSEGTILSGSLELPNK